MKLLDRFKEIVEPNEKKLTNDILSHYILSTKGGTVEVSSDFSISYETNEQQSCYLSKPLKDSIFSLTLVHSPSGSGKTTLLRELYAHIHRYGASSKLNFDFQPDFNLECKIGCGFIPQNPPLVKHWMCKSLLPKNSIFFNVFFPEFTSDELNNFPRKRLSQLSGGQTRRLFACSALEEILRDNNTNLAFLLLDETFDGIGADALTLSLNKLREIWCENSRKPLHLLLVTHLNTCDLYNCLNEYDLILNMEVKSRDGDSLITLLRNEQ